MKNLAVNAETVDRMLPTIQHHSFFDKNAIFDINHECSICKINDSKKSLILNAIIKNCVTTKLKRANNKNYCKQYFTIGNSKQLRINNQKLIERLTNLKK